MVILQSPSKIPRVLLSFYGLLTGTVKDADGLLGSQNCTLYLLLGYPNSKKFLLLFFERRVYFHGENTSSF